MFNLIFNRIRSVPSIKDKGLADWLRDMVFSLNNNFKKLENTFTPGATLQTLAAADRIDHTYDTVEVAGKNGAVTLTSTPTISPGYYGKRLLIIGTSDVNTVLLQDTSSLAGSGLRLTSSANVTLGAGDILYLTYSTTVGAWCTVSASNN